MISVIVTCLIEHKKPNRQDICCVEARILCSILLSTVNLVSCDRFVMLFFLVVDSGVVQLVLFLWIQMWSMLMARVTSEVTWFCLIDLIDPSRQRKPHSKHGAIEIKESKGLFPIKTKENHIQ